MARARARSSAPADARSDATSDTDAPASAPSASKYSRIAWRFDPPPEARTATRTLMARCYSPARLRRQIATHGVHERRHHGCAGWVLVRRQRTRPNQVWASAVLRRGKHVARTVTGE